MLVYTSLSDHGTESNVYPYPFPSRHPECMYQPNPFWIIVLLSLLILVLVIVCDKYRTEKLCDI